MAESSPSPPAAPEWFARAIATPARDAWAAVDGHRVHYRVWGSSGPGLLLVHGGGAHARWWDFIAPFLMTERRVVALDLGGMGDSDRRPQYSLDTFAADVLSVADAAGLDTDAVIVGHSLGGAVSLRVAASAPTRFCGLVMVDSPLTPPGYQFPGVGGNPLRRAKRYYPDRSTAEARFRLLPAQPCANPYIANYIAHHSVREYPEGWSWKFDDNGLEHIRIGQQAQELAALEARIAVLYGADSALFPGEVQGYVRQLVGNRGPVSAIPQAFHHVFLDQPLAFVAALSALLASWTAAAEREATVSGKAPIEQMTAGVMSSDPQ